MGEAVEVEMEVGIMQIGNGGTEVIQVVSLQGSHQMHEIEGCVVDSHR